MTDAIVANLISPLIKILKFLCIIFTLYMIAHFFYEYELNEDATRVTQIRTWQRQIFPSINLCLMSKDNTGLYKKSYINATVGLKEKEYKAMLRGEMTPIDWNRLIGFTDFENSTVKLQDYLRKLKVTDYSGNDVIWEYSKKVSDISQVEPSLVLGGEMDLENFAKTSTIELKYQDPDFICYEYRTDLNTKFTLWEIAFTFDIKSLRKIDHGRMFIHAYYPHHFFRNFRYLYKVNGFNDLSMKKRTNKLVLDINFIRIIKNRKDAKEPCNEALDIDKDHDDEMWLEKVVELVGCIPFYWAHISPKRIDSKPLNICNSTEQMQKVRSYLPLDNEEGINKILRMYDPPCNLMQIMANSNSDRDAHKDNFKISFHFR